ncbi:MAG TPA: hypothetical protein VI895_00270, partial [Bdellovibrionota bacterium]|nr:hypothetical protein [Bdellovibrionota bacterium]
DLSTPHAGWPTWPGMGGRHPPECPADILRNHWPAWPGITGRFAPEYASKAQRIESSKFSDEPGELQGTWCFLRRGLLLMYKRSSYA